MGAVSIRGTGVRQKQDPSRLEALGGLNIFSEEFKFQSFLYLCLGQNEVCRYENVSLSGEICVIDIGSRCSSCDECTLLLTSLGRRYRLDVCFPGGNGKMIRPQLSSWLAPRLSISCVSFVKMKAPGGF